MKNIIFAALLALTSFGVHSQQVDQDCYCPTCPNHVKKCANTGSFYKREATKFKTEIRHNNGKSPASKSSKAISE